MSLTRHHRWIGPFIFTILAVLACGGIIASLYSDASDKTSSEQASTEATNEETTAADTVTGSTQPETTTTTTAVTEKTAPTTVAPASQVTAVGDSVMKGAVYTLQQEIPDLGIVDVQGSIQAPAAIDILRQRRDAGQLGDVVVVHIGNNGPFTDEMFDEMMQVLTGVRKVLIVNMTIPPGVEDPIAVPNNTRLVEGVQRHPNTVLVDWHAASANHPEFFWENDIHLTPQGVQAYADLVAAHLGGP